MNLDVQEMPFDHTHNCSKEEIDTVLAYNKKDVEATVKFYYTTLGKTDYSVYKGKNKLGLRKSISRRWGIPCYNWSDTKIGEQLMLELYC
jgi:DNA-directed RNA polymerase delta subunit